jgi:Ca-activated chloride channel family protein
MLHPTALLLLALIPLLYLLHAYADRRRRISLSRWTAAPQSTRPHHARALQAAAIVAITVALTAPGARPTAITAKGSADIVFLLDVSRSMLAADIAPNRLARAKEIIRDIARQDRGNRVALVAFAGGQSVECPLTVDHGFFGEALGGASPDSVARGGTRIGDAIHFALDRVLDDAQRDRRTIVVVTDGEDHESDPGAAAADAERAKVNVVTIGVGEEAGAIVPISATDPEPFLYHGAPVRSQLDARLLQSMGRYRHAGNVDAASIYREWLAPAGQGSAAIEPSSVTWTLLLAIAIVLLAIEPRRAMAVMMACVLILPARAQTVDEWFKNGLEALDKKQWADALRYFGDAARWAPDVPEIRFNLSKALYEMHSFTEAALGFEHAAQLAKDPHLRAQACLGQGNSLFRDATQPSTNSLRAVAGLRASIDAYREALKLEPDMFAADINLKVAQRKLREYLDRSQNNQPPGPPGTQPQPQPRPQATADDILKQSHRTQPPRTLAKPGPVDKDW